MDTSFPDSRSSFVQSPYGTWNLYPVNNERFDPNSQSAQSQQQQQLQKPPFKRARDSDDNQSNPLPYQHMNSDPRMPPINPPVNKGVSNIFYKTRMCAKFRAGACRNGENCNFAHGIEDLRQPPPNWQELVGGTNEERERSSSVVGNSNWDEDQKIIQRMKLCRKFCLGEECPYGDRCNFLHEDPAKFREDSSSGRYRESSVISIGTTNNGPPMVSESVSNSQVEVDRSALVNNAAVVKPVYWKTRLCTKFEITGHCPFGDKCHFAHGQAELQNIGGRLEGEAVVNLTTPVTKPRALPTNDASAVKIATVTTAPFGNEEWQVKKSLFRWPKKINGIYGDWIDDSPFGQNLSNQLDS